MAQVEVDTCTRNFIFPCADGSVKQEGHVPRPLRCRSRQQEDGNAGGGSEAQRRTQSPNTAGCCIADHFLAATPQAAEHAATEEKDDFLSIAGYFIHRHRVALRGHLYVPSKTSFPILLMYIDVIRQTKTFGNFGREHH